MKILVIDGQGGRIGAMLTAEINKILTEKDELIAVGTNTLATAAMLKAGAVNAATGENPIVVNAKTADVIVGTIGIAVADALLGEITPKMAKAIGQSNALKILVPMNKCSVYVVGTKEISVSEAVMLAVEKIKELL